MLAWIRRQAQVNDLHCIWTTRQCGQCLHLLHDVFRAIENFGHVCYKIASYTAHS